MRSGCHCLLVEPPKVRIRSIVEVGLSVLHAPLDFPVEGPRAATLGAMGRKGVVLVRSPSPSRGADAKILLADP